MELIALASVVDRALQGMMLVPQRRHDSTGRKEVPLINLPRDIFLTNVPASAACSVACCFSRPEESAAFCDGVMEMGWSAAFLMHKETMLWAASDCKGSQKWSKHIGKIMNMKVSEACITYCVYVPMKSFQIPMANMELCKSALQSASMVQTREDAEGFFEMYNSHVSQNVYHLGGVFFREVTYKWMEEISLPNLMTQALQTIRGYMQQDEACLPSPHRSCSTDSTGKGILASKLNQRIETITALGPSTAQEEAGFKRQLNDDPLCWSIIDKEMDGKEQLVSVWELLANYAQLHAADAIRFKRAAKLLCECWHDCVMAVAAEARALGLPLQSASLYYELLHQSSLFVANLSLDPMLTEELFPTLPPAPSYNHEEVVTVLALTQHLQSLVDEAEHLGIEADMALETSRWITFSLDRSQMLTRKTAEFQRALEILKSYGFDAHNQRFMRPLHLDKLRGMILELRKVYKPKQPGDFTPQTLYGSTLIPSHISTSKVTAFRYIGDVVVDRKFYQNSYLCEPGCSDQHSTPHDVQLLQHAAARNLIDCLRHHVNPLKHMYQVQSRSSAATKDDWDSAFEDEDDEDVIKALAATIDNWDSAFEDEKNDQDVLKASSLQTRAPNLHEQPLMPFELLIQIMQNSDLPLQAALTKLLLFQRAAAPLVFPNIKHGEHVCSGGKLPLTHCVQAFCFWNVSLAKEQKLCIASDTSLPRVFFLSNRRVQDAHTAIVASRVLHCNFLSQHGHGNMGQVITPVIEVGVGFLTSRGSEPLACLSFHVTGSYQQVMGFVEAVADIIILELDQGLTEQQPPTKSVKVLQWQETDAHKFSDRKNRMIWGQESYVVGEIQSFLSNACQRKMPKCREALKEVCAAHFHPHQLISFEELQDMVGHCDFATVKKSLKLQRSFLEEAQAHFDVLQLKDNPDEKRARAHRCQQERRSRSRLATEVRNHLMLLLFCKILAQPDVTSRRLGVMWLEKRIAEMMFPLLEEAALKIDSSFEAWQRNSKDRQAKEIYITAKQDYIERNLRMDNLWRELCHLYEADPLNQRHLAKQAAQHLLDGFPLEVLDGDAGVFCKTWVESVLVELDMMTRSEPDGRAARIFVLSVMGLQSSGKSTVLNLMFGTQLQTSAGRCTRGVYMQLVPSERAEYDYVMVLDTEGIRSPEHFGLRSSEAHDNRIATFGLLPADASIFMVSNEDDSGLKEVLPMVLLAFKGSAMAESCGGRIKAKMVFVYRSVDTNDKQKLKGNREKLQEYLREAAEQVANIGFSSAEEGNVNILTNDKDQWGSDLLQAVFTEFRVDKDEGKSDVKCMGSLKKACVPPDDTPDWAYGEQVIELREYVHKRVIEGGWHGTGLIAWAEHLTRVWDCVCSADFELSFRSAIEYSAFRDLQAKLRPLRTELCQKYLEEFETLEQHMIRTMSEEESSITLFGILEKNVEDVVRSKSKELENILATKIYANWRAGELGNWNHFCAATKEWYKRRIEDMENGIVKFEKVVTNYERQIKEMIMQKMDNGDWSMMDGSEETRNHKFDELFESILHMAKEVHPPIWERVSNNVLDRYKQHGLGKKFDLYAKPAIVIEEPRRNWVQRIFHYVGHQQRISRQEELRSTLQTIIDQQLRDARQYSEVLVDNVILQTTRVLERHGLGNADQEAAHTWVIQTLTARMVEIQRHWDNDHNVLEKLRSKAKPRLYRFFKARAEGLEAASLLIKELQSLFEDELVEVHSLFVVKKVAAQLGHAEWVMDWRVMRDCLDLQLLALTEKKTKENTDMLLRFVSDGSAHFQELTRCFIRRSITTEILEQAWEALVQRLETCLEEKSSANMTVDTFLAQLSNRLGKHVDAKLANAVASSIHHDYFKDHVLDSDFYQQKVPEMCQRLRKKNRPDAEVVREKLIERVRERMVQREDESCRPRCDARCPLCGITCFHSAGHVGKHDAIHQPGGLSGVHHYISHELDAKTCLDSLNENWEFRHKAGEGDFIPYKNFHIEFPSWVNPSKNEKIAIEVREYIFFNYQAELVKFYSRNHREKKPCPADKMPPEYNHDAKCLRAGLYNRLRPIFGDSGAGHEALLDLQLI